ncbi:signal transduction protein [Methanomicrobiaceae archaeon CYW5]|uniref:CBS domain-containing protein n=1 Tax=Methanovulcanius yangii TaxID=1789227 RepID=UPI0029C9FCCF|nr:CBS domain-containing protein [Methanovulcanius yangii]MBT8507488.1 signal transduction protein [Methanovulcanius yangii]
MSDELFVKDVMSRPITIAKSAPITEALDKMLADGIDPLIVTNNGGVMGTISRAAIAETLGSRKTSSLSPTKIHVANKTDENFTSVYPDEEAEILIPLLQEFKVVVVLDSEHHLIGKVDATDLLKVLKPETTTENLLQTAPVIGPEERVIHLRRRMIDEEATKFVVTEEGEILGIVTETDVARAMRDFRLRVDDRHQENQVKHIRVGDIMTSPAIVREYTTAVPEFIDLIVGKNISSVPVIRDGKFAGIITKEALLVAL